MSFKHTIDVEHAARVADWIKNRGGLFVWSSVNLSNPGAGWTTPFLNADNTEVTKPSWQCGQNPQHFTDASEIGVVTYKEVKRFRVGVTRGGGVLDYVVTDGGTRRIRREVAKAGEGATYHFDYGTQEAVILKVEQTISLTEWLAQQEAQELVKDLHAQY